MLPDLYPVRISTSLLSRHHLVTKKNPNTSIRSQYNTLFNIPSAYSVDMFEAMSQT